MQMDMSLNIKSFQNNLTTLPFKTTVGSPLESMISLTLKFSSGLEYQA